MSSRGKVVLGILRCYLLVLASFVASAQKQNTDISFKHLSTVDGLSNFTVFSIAQDRQGFMWFGTMDGLNRFDGRHMRTYKVDDLEPGSLGNNHVYSLLCTSDTGMWVGTANGLYHYNFIYDDFSRIALTNNTGTEAPILEVKSMMQNGDHLWIGTSQGLFVYDLREKRISTSLAKLIDSISATVETIHRSGDGNIWIGGREGLFIFSDDKLARIESDPMGKYHDGSNVISIISDRQDRIWFGTMDLESGLMIYDPTNGSFTELNRKDGYLPHNKVNCLFSLDDGKIWAGTTWGLAILDEISFSSQHYLYDRRNPGSISQNSIRKIFSGTNDIIWIGTYSGGVNFFDRRSQLIRHETNIYENETSINFNIVASIFEDSEQNLWIGTEYGGVNIYDRQRGTYRVLMRKPGINSLINDNIKSVVEDRFGRKFIATQFGLSIYDPSTRTFFNIDDAETSRGKLNFKIVVDLCMDGDGDVWIGTNKWIGTSRMTGPGYVLKYDVSSDTIIHFPTENAASSIVDGGVNCMIYDDVRNMIWSGGDNGITGFNLDDHSYISDDVFLEMTEVFDGVVINDIVLDQFGLLWVATFGYGLYVVDLESYRVRQLGDANGLPESSFYSLVRDDDAIWISTNAQLLKIHQFTEFEDGDIQIDNFGIQEGFPPQQYFRNAAYKDRDGILYFGGDDGYIAFDPKEVEKIILTPSVILLNLYVNGEPFNIEAAHGDQHLNLAALDEVTLNHNQSSFSVEFIGPNYINPGNTWYQYQLVGMDDDWQGLRNSHEINFAELKRGNYELRVRASSDPERFAEEYTSIAINVLPPYWATSWAYLIYLAVIMISLYVLFTLSRKWERLNQNLKFEHLQREQEKEFNQKRIKFFTDISHELRTPLTLILAPLERIVKSNFGNAKVRNQLMLMLRNGDRMLQLINQLLNLRKLETGHMHLQVAKGNIVRFVIETSLSFRELANDRQIQFDVDASRDNIKMYFDRNKFEIILFNLLSNAVKYTPKNGRIRISVKEAELESAAQSSEEHENRAINISIENSGRGIPTQEIDHIFERFFSGERDSLQSKTSSGVGLEIVKNLVELHKGSISVVSTHAEDGVSGLTKFTVTLKRGKEHFSPNEIIKDFKSSEDIANYGGVALEPYLEESESELEGTQELNGNDPSESVLIVEDNEEVRNLVANLFREEYKVFEATNGKEALEISQKQIPDLVISDIMMPVMDGIELCRELKTNVNTSHIPVILLTARTAVTFRYEGLETGADDYIVKPFNVEGLRLRAKNLIGQRKKLKEKYTQSGLSIPTEVSLTSVDEKLMQKTIDYIIENIGSSDLSVDRIASEVGMSRTNFYRKIKALTNRSAAEFLRSVRMNYAAQLLKTNKVRVSEVGPMVGISDVDYFRECFKKQFGLSPRAYIESQEISPDLSHKG